MKSLHRFIIPVAAALLAAALPGCAPEQYKQDYNPLIDGGGDEKQPEKPDEEQTRNELYRPQIHFTPAKNWMNDPNGMVYADGVYHLFYQYNPMANVWGNMSWGHATSNDLIHWEEKPVALTRDELGDIFSGSAVIDKDNTAGFGKGAMVAIFTSAGARQTQSIAYSTDGGRTFTKYAGNPVITSDVRDFRDPKVIWNPEIGKWNLVLAAGNEVRFYSSPDLKHWNFESGFGSDGYGSHGGVWECPDIFPVKVEGTDAKKWVLLVNNGGGPAGGTATQYFVGEFDGKTFKCDSPAETVKWMDWGKDHYATVSFSNAPDNRNVVLAWMNNWDYANRVPTVQFRSGDSIPRDLSLYEKDGEYYLSVVPSPEMDAARGAAAKVDAGTVTAEGKEFNYALAACGGVGEIEVAFTASAPAKFGVELFNTQGESVKFCYDLEASTFACDRTESGVVDFHPTFAAVSAAPLVKADNYVLRLFVDKCSVEAFDAKGRFALTDQVFPHESFSGIRLVALDGDVTVSSMNVYPINR
jgi:fructan beta-fructosidase